jgi:hypothetical protein
VTAVARGKADTVHALRSWALWWLVLFGFWNLMQGAWEEMEIAAGAGAAALGATFAELARRQNLLAFAPDLRWLLKTLRLFWRLPYELGVVTAALVLDVLRIRRVRSEWAVSPLPTGSKAAIGAGNRAAVLAIENVAPNTMAVQTAGGREALKHDLVPGRGTAALPS